MNVGLSKTEKSVLDYILTTKEETAKTLAQKLSLTTRIIERALKALQTKGFIRRVGSKRDGFWLVIK